MPIAHQTVCQFRLWFAGGFRQSARHQFLADPDAKTTRDELVEQKAFGAGKGLPRGQHKYPAIGVFHIRKATQGVDPIGKGAIIHSLALWQNQRDRLGQIADDGIAVLKEPKGDVGDLCCPFAQLCGGYGPFWPPTREEGNCPQLIHRVRIGEILSQSSDFHVGLGALVDGLKEACKTFHASAS